MYVVFYSTSYVFEAEERLKEKGIECKIVPTPVTDKAYCGISVQTDNSDILAILKGMEFQIIS
ncbi:MAG: DUF3343 domain-containing protein [Clostridia bacterium]